MLCRLPPNISTMCYIFTHTVLGCVYMTGAFTRWCTYLSVESSICATPSTLCPQRQAGISTGWPEPGTSTSCCCTRGKECILSEVRPRCCKTLENSLPQLMMLDLRLGRAICDTRYTRQPAQYVNTSIRSTILVVSACLITTHHLCAFLLYLAR